MEMKGAADSQWPDICNMVVCSVISPGRQLPGTSKGNGRIPPVGSGRIVCLAFVTRMKVKV